MSTGRKDGFMSRTHTCKAMHDVIVLGTTGTTYIFYDRERNRKKTNRKKHNNTKGRAPQKDVAENTKQEK